MKVLNITYTFKEANILSLNDRLTKLETEIIKQNVVLGLVICSEFYLCDINYSIGKITYYKKSSFMSEITRQAGLGRTKLTMKDPFTNIPLNQFYIMPWMNEPVGKRSAKAKPPAGKRAKASAEAEAHPGAALGGTLKKRRRRRNTRRRRRSLMR